MSLAIRGSATAGSQASGTAFTVAAPTGLTAGDVIMIFSCALSGSISSLAGFSDSGQAAASSFSARAFTRTATGSEGATFSIASTGTPGAAVCVAVSGNGGPDPSALAACFVSASNGLTVPVPGVTLSFTGDWLIWFGASMRNASTTPGTVTVPSGYTALGNTGAVTGASESCYIAAGALETAQPAGATGTQTGSTSLNVPRSGFLTGVALPAGGLFAAIPF